MTVPGVYDPRHVLHERSSIPRGGIAMAWTLDTAHTTVGFSARHMGLSRVRGVFRDVDGTIALEPDDLTKTSGKVEIRTASIDTGDEQRDAHLRSPDFFDAERFPTMTFEPTSVERIDDERYRVRGNLMIRDTTNEIELVYEHAGEMIDPYGHRKLGGRLSGTIKRSDWGLTWNVALEAGGWLVSDTIELEIEGQVAESEEAIEQEVAAETELEEERQAS
jgi:polyisoprenoid-binding protein YceI